MAGRALLASDRAIGPEASAIPGAGKAAAAGMLTWLVQAPPESAGDEQSGVQRRVVLAVLGLFKLRCAVKPRFRRWRS